MTPTYFQVQAMPVYEFQSVDNGDEVIGRFYRASDAPELGTLISNDGKFYKRILSVGAEVRVENLTPSPTMPAWSPGFTHDDKGNCYTRGSKHAKDCAKRNQLVERNF
jgi:hypothetical protein